jgi:hypothetical protein
MESRRHTEDSQSNPASSEEGQRYSYGGIGRSLSKRLSLILLFGLIALGIVAAWYKIAGSTSIVPKKIQTSVDFSVYYPKDLPPGYELDAESFRLAEPGVVLFAVNYGDRKDIVFSEQQQPPSSDIDKFITSYMPLNTVLQLPLGQARIGAYGSAPNIRTVVSLPIHNGPWLIVTAPADASHDDLVRIVQSLAK